VAPNTPPIARFTFSCSRLTCHFDGTGSSDADGTIDSYRWDFGDGTSARGGTADHSHAHAAAYPVTLTVTDNAGAT
jgi:PKD repeat protein